MSGELARISFRLSMMDGVFVYDPRTRVQLCYCDLAEFLQEQYNLCLDELEVVDLVFFGEPAANRTKYRRVTIEAFPKVVVVRWVDLQMYDNTWRRVNPFMSLDGVRNIHPRVFFGPGYFQVEYRERATRRTHRK